MSFLIDDDIYLLNQGNYFHPCDTLGTHLTIESDNCGAYFAVWAPHAEHAFATGDFTGRNNISHRLSSKG